MNLPGIKLNKETILLIVIFAFAFLVRFYNFENRITFWSEQARSLVVSANYIKEKPSLLGQEYFRQDSNGHKLFSGALFNYSLVPLLLISNYDPVPVTAFFAFLNILTGLTIYMVVKTVFGKNVALISTTLFLFNDFMIYHSLFIWNYNYLPLIGILSLYLTWLYLKKQKGKYVFLLGLAGGVGISLQFLFAPLAAGLMFFTIRKSKRKLKDAALFLLGAILGNLPMIIFDLKHNFYHLITLTQYTLDTLRGKSDAGFSYYYLLPFWPVFAILTAYLIFRIFKFNKVIGFIVIILYLYLNLSSSRVSFTKPTGMPDGLKIADIARASSLISSDSSGEFNVAEVLDFDKRAYVLRYYVEFKYGKKPLSEIDYQNLNLLYVLAQKGYNFGKSGVWEVNAGGPYKIGLLSEVGKGYAIYKLQK